MARPTGAFWTAEDGLQPVQPMVSGRALGDHVRGSLRRTRRRRPIGNNRRRNDRPSPSRCGRRKRGGERNALGHSRGGFSTKLLVIVTAKGRPLHARALVVSPAVGCASIAHPATRRTQCVAGTHNRGHSRDSSNSWRPVGQPAAAHPGRRRMDAWTRCEARCIVPGLGRNGRAHLEDEQHARKRYVQCRRRRLSSAGT